MRGRKPLATATKEASGAFVVNPGRRNKHEPKAKTGAPKMPKTLTGNKVARDMWKATCALLDYLNVLTTADVHLIEAYSLNESALRAAADDLKTNGRITQTKRGEHLNPMWRVWANCLDRRIKITAELGLTPSSRSRLHAVSDDATDPFLDYMQQKAKHN